MPLLIAKVHCLFIHVFYAFDLICSLCAFLSYNMLCSKHALGTRRPGWSGLCREPLRDGDLVLHACAALGHTGECQTWVCSATNLYSLYPCRGFHREVTKGCPALHCSCRPALSHMLPLASWPRGVVSGAFSPDTGFPSRRDARLSTVRAARTQFFLSTT